jgi:hypothetical protein
MTIAKTITITITKAIAIAMVLMNGIMLNNE